MKDYNLSKSNGREINLGRLEEIAINAIKERYDLDNFDFLFILNSNNEFKDNIMTTFVEANSNIYVTFNDYKPILMSAPNEKGGEYTDRTLWVFSEDNESYKL